MKKVLPHPTGDGGSVNEGLVDVLFLGVERQLILIVARVEV